MSRSSKRLKPSEDEPLTDGELYSTATRGLPIMRSASAALNNLTSENLSVYANALLIPKVVENAVIPEPLIPVSLKDDPVILLRDNVRLPAAIARGLLRQCFANEKGGHCVLVCRDGALCLPRYRVTDEYLRMADSTIKLKETPGLPELINAVNAFVQSIEDINFELSIAEFRSLLTGLASAKVVPHLGIQQLTTMVKVLHASTIEQLDLTDLNNELGGRTRPLYDTLLGLKLGRLSFEELVGFLSDSPIEDASKRAILCVHPGAAIPYVKSKPTVFDSEGNSLVPVKVSELTDGAEVHCTLSYVTQSALGQISANSLVFTDPVYTKIGNVKGGRPRLTPTPATDATISGKAAKFLASLNKTKTTTTNTGGNEEAAALPDYEEADLECAFDVH